MLTRCEQEFETQLAELNELASRAPPYHLRDSPDCENKLNGYAIVRALEPVNSWEYNVRYWHIVNNYISHRMELMLGQN